jgi:uncharacterized protein YacL
MNIEVVISMQDYNAMIETIQKLVDFASYFIFSFIGSLLKEMYNTNSVKEYAFEPYKVIISTMVASLIALAVKEYYYDFLNQYWGIMGIISLVLGFIGFELFRYISSIKGIRKIVGIIYEKDEDVLDRLDSAIESEDDNKNTNTANSNYKHIHGPVARTIHPDNKLIGYKVSKPIIHAPEEDGNKKNN